MNLIALEHDDRRVIEANAHASAAVVKDLIVDDVDGRLSLHDHAPEAVFENAATANVTAHVVLHRDAEGVVMCDDAVAQNEMRHILGHKDAFLPVALDVAVNGGRWSRMIPHKQALTGIMSKR